jgi:hypothetical protein
MADLEHACAVFEIEVDPRTPTLVVEADTYEVAVAPDGPRVIVAAIPVRGETGTEILSGFGEPDASVGRVGDYYTDTDARILYGPKIAEGAFGPPESVVNIIPSGPAASNFRFGDVLLPKVDGQIVSGRFRKPATSAQTSRQFYVFDKNNTFVAASNASSGEPVGVDSWIVLDFPTPIPVVAGEKFTILTDSDTFFAVQPATPANPDHITIVNGALGTYGSAATAYPSYFDANYWHVDVVWQTTGTVWPVGAVGKQGPPGPSTVSDVALTIFDDARPGAAAKFNLAYITDGATRYFILPDVDCILVGDTVYMELTNKTINLGLNTLVATLAQLNAAVSDAELVSGSVNGVPTALKLWKGNQAQLDAITTRDPNTFYAVI